ncbi:MAG: PHP domain-containing protein [Pseudomonadota bacterium]
MRRKPKFYRFNDLGKIGGEIDYHIHTNWTDGQHSPREIIKQAKKLGINSIAFTEHVRKESTYFKDFYKEIDELRNNEDLEIFIGIETKVVNKQGDLDISRHDYDLAEIVLGSVHRILKDGSLVNIRDLEMKEAIQEELEYGLALVKGGKIDVLAHPAGMSLQGFNSFPTGYLEQLIRGIAKTEMAFELNPKYLNDEHLKKVIDLCVKYDPFISIGSDHHSKEMGSTKKVLEGIK